MDIVLSIILNRKNPERTVEYNQTNQNTYISLPRLFNCANREVRHGIILKDGNDEQLENKIVLLTYEIESEAELSLNKIFPLPKFFTIMKFSYFFRGIVFYNHHRDINSEKLVLLLNSEHLIQNILKELKT